jgi:hypothetical protein
MAIAHGPASPEELIGLWQTGQITGPAMALPIHYASAGMVGVAMGIGLAQAIDRVRFADEVVREDSADVDADERDSEPQTPDTGESLPATIETDEPIELEGVEPDDEAEGNEPSDSAKI